MKRWVFQSTSFSVYRNVCLYQKYSFNHLLPNDLYTLLCFRYSFHSADSVGKDILFCNFWLVFRLVRIANVYGFMRWLF